MNCQDHFHSCADPRLVTRRWFLDQCGIGLGGIALSQLLGSRGSAETAAVNPLAARQPHFAPKAKNVIFLFMAGAPSHLELFDNKPQLAKFNGTLPPPELLAGYRAAFINPNSKLLGPKFSFARHGACGAELSELLPHLAGVVDEMAIVKSMVTDAFNHAPGQILMSTGSQQFGRPSVGAWVTYGLGSESQELPGFVVFSSGKKGPSGGNSNWGSGFLPTVYQGVQFRGSGQPGRHHRLRRQPQRPEPVGHQHRHRHGDSDDPGRRGAGRGSGQPGRHDGLCRHPRQQHRGGDQYEHRHGNEDDPGGR